MKKPEVIQFSEIISLLEALCLKGETGTLFIATDTHKFGQIAIHNGQISFILFAGKRGMDAIPLLRMQKKGRCNFKPGELPSLSDTLPAKNIVLEQLHASGWLPQKRNGQSDNVFPDGGSISVAQKNILREELAKYIGPVAAIVCDEHCGPGAHLDSVLQAMAAEIGSDGEIQSFLADAKKALAI